MVKIKDIVKFNEEFHKMQIGDLPEDEVEKEIFSHLDILSANIAGILTSYVDNKIPNTSTDDATADLKKALDSLIINKGVKKFRENTILYNLYLLCLKGIELLKRIDKEGIEK